jgi:hypothetical protein
MARVRSWWLMASCSLTLLCIPALGGYVTNGDFESEPDHLAGWVVTPEGGVVASESGGNFRAVLDELLPEEYTGVLSLAQAITLDAGCYELSFDLEISSGAGEIEPESDYFRVLFGGDEVYTWNNEGYVGDPLYVTGTVTRSVHVGAGGGVQLEFRLEYDGTEPYTLVSLDNVTLEPCAAEVPLPADVVLTSIGTALCLLLKGSQRPSAASRQRSVGAGQGI